MFILCVVFCLLAQAFIQCYCEICTFVCLVLMLFVVFMWLCVMFRDKIKCLWIVLCLFQQNYHKTITMYATCKTAKKFTFLWVFYNHFGLTDWLQSYTESYSWYDICEMISASIICGHDLEQNISSGAKSFILWNTNCTHIADCLESSLRCQKIYAR